MNLPRPNSIISVMSRKGDLCLANAGADATRRLYQRQSHAATPTITVKDNVKTRIRLPNFSPVMLFLLY